MQEAIQFETNVESGVIRIPEQYIRAVPANVKVTLVPVANPRIKAGTKAKSDALTLNDYSALKINTKGFKFDREEANER
jgi:hypothetical protein